MHEVQSTRALHGADCYIDHRLIRNTLRLTVRPPSHRHKPMRKLRVPAADDLIMGEIQRNAITQSLSREPTTTTSKYTSNHTMN